MCLVTCQIILLLFNVQFRFFFFLFSFSNFIPLKEQAAVDVI